jgi:anaerobic selenocysteine-containing dehydrogenase
MGMVHRSAGVVKPPTNSRSEVSIVCDIADVLFGRSHAIDWKAMRADNKVVRDHISAVIPGFHAFNDRVGVPGGFALPHPPRDGREFPTSSGKAEFANTTVKRRVVAPGSLLLQTLRSHDQYNTTIYGHSDRYRGISGDRNVILINPADIGSLGFVDGDVVDVVSEFAGVRRRASGYRIVAYPTPVGSAAAYYPEANVLLPIEHHGEDAQTPAAKSIPIVLERR